MSKVLRARSELGNATRRGDAAAVLDARRDLAAAKLEDYITKVLADAPPLTAEQVDGVAAVLVTASGRDGR